MMKQVRQRHRFLILSSLSSCCCSSHLVSQARPFHSTISQSPIGNNWSDLSNLQETLVILEMKNQERVGNEGGAATI